MLRKSLTSLVIASVCVGSLEAASLKDVVEHTLSNNPAIDSKSLNNKAFRKYVDEEKGGYYPTLDLTANYGTEREDIDYDNSSSTDIDEKKTGTTFQLDAEQLIYDGGLTSGKVKQAEYRYESNSLNNALEIENIIYNSVKSYLDILKFDERMKSAKDSISIYEDYLSIAKDTEEISGEILDKVQTNAKIRYSNNAYLNESLNKKIALSSFKKNVNMPLDSNICKPNLDDSKVSKSLKELIDTTLLTNYSILEQISKINEQKAILTQSDANFLPVLKFKLQGVYSDDLLYDEADSKAYSAKLELKYNLFNGGKDSISTQREELFVREAQRELDVVTNAVVDEVTIAYETYNTSKKQIKELSGYINDNKKILEIYKDQFEGGTRTFIDVLNIETDIYNAKINLLNAEYNMYDAYYELLNKQSILQKSILNSQNQTCTNVKTKNTPKKMKAAKIDEDIDSIKKMLNEDSSSKDIKSDNMLNTYYVLYIESYKDEEIAKKALNYVEKEINTSLDSKVISNDNGTFTVVLYNVATLEEVVNAKNSLNKKFPTSYYSKKTRK